MALSQIIPNFNPGLLAEFDFGLLLMEVLLFGSSLFLILLILVQRGKGGGLTGALGGAGGQSAFGAKAGDAFTKITIVTAVFWIMLCMVTIARFNPPPTAAEVSNNNAGMSADESDDPGEDGLGDGSFDPNADTPESTGAGEEASGTGSVDDEAPSGTSETANPDSDNGN